MPPAPLARGRGASSPSRHPPPPSSPAAADAPGGLDIAAAAEAVRRLVFPESVAAPSELTWPVLVFGSLAVGLALEAATLALKVVTREDDDDGGEGAGAPPKQAPPPPQSPPLRTRPSPAAPTLPSRADIDAERARLRDRVVAERYRGLAWLAAATAAALWSAGLVSGPNALAP